jgi:hypothetical protein
LAAPVPRTHTRRSRVRIDEIAVEARLEHRQPSGRACARVDGRGVDAASGGSTQEIPSGIGTPLVEPSLTTKQTAACRSSTARMSRPSLRQPASTRARRAMRSAAISLASSVAAPSEPIVRSFTAPAFFCARRQLALHALLPRTPRVRRHARTHAGARLASTYAAGIARAIAAVPRAGGVRLLWRTVHRHERRQQRLWRARQRWVRMNERASTFAPARLTYARGPRARGERRQTRDSRVERQRGQARSPELTGATGGMHGSACGASAQRLRTCSASSSNDGRVLNCRQAASMHTRSHTRAKSGDEIAASRNSRHAVRSRCAAPRAMGQSTGQWASKGPVIRGFLRP